MALEDVQMAEPSPDEAPLPAPSQPELPPSSGGDVKITDPDILRWMQQTKQQPSGGAPVPKTTSRGAAPAPMAPRSSDPRAPMNAGQRGYWDAQNWGAVGKNALRNALPSTGAGLTQIGHALNPMNWRETADNISHLATPEGVNALKNYVAPYGKALTGETAPLKKAVSMDPFGVAMDVSTPFTLGESLPGRAGEIAGQAARFTDPVRASVAAAKGVLYPAKKAAQFFQHVGTGVPVETLELAGKAGASADKEIRAAYNGAKSGKISGDQILDAISNATAQYSRQLKTNAIAAKKGTFTARALPWGDVDAALNSAKNQAGLSAGAPVNLAHPAYLPGAKAGVSQAEGLIQAWKANPADHNMAGFDNLRAQLYEMSHNPGLVGREKDIMNGIYNAVRQTMAREAPEYANSLEGIQNAQDYIKEMRRTLGTGNNIMNANAIRRQMRAFNTPSGRNMLDEISKFDKRIPYLISGASHEAVMPQGLARYLEGGTMVAAAHGALTNPAIWPAAAATVAGATAFTSPRFAGASNYLYGLPSRLAKSSVKNAAYYAGRDYSGLSGPSDSAVSMNNADFANKALPRNARNHNFGNIEDGPFAKSQPGYAGSDGTFARFKSPEHGARATKRLIRNYLRMGRDTPAKFATNWTKTKADQATYAANIADALGINADSKIDHAIDDVTLNKIFHAVARQEGSDYVEPEEAGRETRARGGKVKIDHAAEAATLIRRAERAKNSLGKTTEPLLNVPDEHIAKALAVASESI